MYRDKLAEPLKKLGLKPNNFHALRLLPLLHVAWANNKLSQIEREQILKTARERLELNAEAMQLVHHWLSAPPTEKLIRDGVACLTRVADAPDQPDLGTDDLLRILWEAERMTRNVAIVSGVPYQPSPEQHDALLEVAELMGLDSGMPWLDLLVSLGGKSEAERTLPRDSQKDEPRAPPPSKEDRARRWRTAFRLHSSHDHRVAPKGGII